MIRNKSFINFICAISIATILLVTVTGKIIPASALAVGPLVDPVYDTEIIAFKDYVEANLNAPQLDIMFFLIGGLAVAQMGAQDAMLISPYPNEENVKEWIINCGIQLYNSVIGLVPKGDYYMGIPSIGTGGQKGVPRQIIKALVAQMMGDAVVAANYPTLDDFLDNNPGKIFLPFNRDLQLGVNAVFGLNGGLYDWQINTSSFHSSVEWYHKTLTAVEFADYNDRISYFPYPSPEVRANAYATAPSETTNYAVFNQKDFHSFFSTYTNILISPIGTIRFYTDNGVMYNGSSEALYMIVYSNSYPYNSNFSVSSRADYNGFGNMNISYTPSSYTNFADVARDVYNFVLLPSSNKRIFYEDFIKHVYVGADWNNKTEIFNQTDLNVSDVLNQYYDQLETDYLFDLRGLMGDLVNYVYINPIWDNIYDLVGNLVVPDRVKVSVDLTPITDLLAPPLPVNLNDIDLYTDNDYLREIKERSTKFGETLGEYFVFWHNSDPMTVYVIFGSVIVILIGAFIGKWGHS